MSQITAGLLFCSVAALLSCAAGCSDERQVGPPGGQAETIPAAEPQDAATAPQAGSADSADSTDASSSEADN
jgi:hypothetical protein